MAAVLVVFVGSQPVVSAMGSYGDVWLRCRWCARWGKCTYALCGAEPLIGVDAVGGVLCEPCINRGCQPHPDWLRRLLGPGFRRLESGLNISVANHMAEYAYNGHGAWDWPHAIAGAPGAVQPATALTGLAAGTVAVGPPPHGAQALNRLTAGAAAVGKPALGTPAVVAPTVSR